MNKIIEEENPHFEELTPYEIRIKDEISYLSITEEFKVINKPINKKKDAKIKSSRNHL